MGIVLVGSTDTQRAFTLQTDLLLLCSGIHLCKESEQIIRFSLLHRLINLSENIPVLPRVHLLCDSCVPHCHTMPGSNWRSQNPRPNP